MITNVVVDLIVPEARADDEPAKGSSLGDLLARVSGSTRRDLAGPQ